MSVTERPLPVHAPMLQFPTQGGELLVGGEPLSLLAARVGQTPFYAYDRALLQARVAHSTEPIQQATQTLLGLLAISAWLTPWLCLAGPLALWLWRRFLLTRLGGVTGDCLGAGIECVETGLLLAGVGWQLSGALAWLVSLMG